MAYFSYRGFARELIKQFKYNDVSTLAPYFGQKMAALIEPNWRDFVLVPIPSHQSKKRIRGYNQAALLAREISSLSRLALVEVLRRKTIGQVQADLPSKSERRGNVRGIFDLMPNLLLPKKILLIDDVVTSGATVEEATKFLKRHGVEKVIVLALALS